MRPLRSISRPWALASLAMVAIIWGNSLVPGTASGETSHAVLEMVHAFLQGFGLPYGWVTNFLVRKAAHFTEYAVLGVLVSQALDGSHRCDRAALLAAAGVLVLVPSLDETIQLFVSGRAGQLADVLLDCCGAAFGVAIRCLACKLAARRGAARGSQTDGV